MTVTPAPLRVVIAEDSVLIRKGSPGVDKSAIDPHSSLLRHGPMRAATSLGARAGRGAGTIGVDHLWRTFVPVLTVRAALDDLRRQDWFEFHAIAAGG